MEKQSQFFQHLVARGEQAVEDVRYGIGLWFDGGFGTYLITGNEWARFDALIARTCRRVDSSSPQGVEVPNTTGVLARSSSGGVPGHLAQDVPGAPVPRGAAGKLRSDMCAAR
ncbi:MULTISPECIES: hypothetical protein [Streptomyces]|uniref:hypothetical protein n=1 Tax=Streptomyces lycopersici TaxID=2974589 RepID=UPI0021D3C681|nr:hypothetical protein [Streptomyces sp. NEAU-383]